MLSFAFAFAVVYVDDTRTEGYVLGISRDRVLRNRFFAGLRPTVAARL